jgi:uncharacterized protein (TIGR02246 family)
VVATALATAHGIADYAFMNGRPLMLMIILAFATLAGHDSSARLQTTIADEHAIAQVIADRQSAWNSGDEQAYARLLTEDADLASSTGRFAKGRNNVIQLYREQRRGAFQGATTLMRVVQTRLIRPDVALVDAERELAGLQTSAAASQSRTTFVLVKQTDGRWLITAQRANAASR